MIRRIKFRGKCIDTIQDKQKWVYGYYVQTVSDGHLTDYIYNDECGWHEIISGTQGQYIGLKDKNGVEIYEGDIIGLDGWIAEIVFNQRHSWFVLEYRIFPHLPYSKTTNEWYSTVKDEIDFEVIGNIYENPELLKP